MNILHLIYLYYFILYLMKIVGISGSLKKNSTNTGLLRAVK